MPHPSNSRIREPASRFRLQRPYRKISLNFFKRCVDDRQVRQNQALLCVSVAKFSSGYNEIQ
jgi:hypothetical protein